MEKWVCFFYYNTTVGVYTLTVVYICTLYFPTIIPNTNLAPDGAQSGTTLSLTVRRTQAGAWTCIVYKVEGLYQTGSIKIAQKRKASMA